MYKSEKSRKKRIMMKSLMISGLICAQLTACGNVNAGQGTEETEAEIASEMVEGTEKETAVEDVKEVSEESLSDETETTTEQEDKTEALEKQTKQEVIHGVTVEWKASDEYDFLVKAGNMTYMINLDDYYLRTEEDVHNFIEHSLEAKEKIDTYLRESGAAEYIEERRFTIKKYTVCEGVARERSRTKSENYMDINVSIDSWAHEYAHTMTMDLDDKRDSDGYIRDGFHVYTEGIAEYLGRIIDDECYYWEYYNEEYARDISNRGSDGESENNAQKEAIENKIVEEYKKKYPTPEKMADAYFPYYYLMLAKVSVQYMENEELTEEEYQTYFPSLYKVYNLPASSRNLGDELSYEQAGSFVAYLSETYGFDMVIKAYMNGENFEESYGKSYEELKEDWIQWILEL